MSADTDLLKYDRFDLDKFVEQQELSKQGGLHRGGGQQRQTAAPVSSSWTTWHVQFPSRLALVTMLVIFIYEVLVTVSMFVRTLRFQMVNWLAWVMLGIIGVLLGILGAIVAYHKLDLECMRKVRGMAATSNAAKEFEE